jgi:glycosyltransferase involved in cell wall biosynthesis
LKVLEVVGVCGGGLSRHLRSLCQGLITHGHQVTVAYSPHMLDQSFQRFLVARREEIHSTPLRVGMEISPKSDLRAVSQLMRLMKEQGPFDLIHGHSAKGGAIARIAGRRFNTPTVYTPHGLIASSPETSRLKAAVYTSIEYVLGRWATSRMIAVSEGERRFIRRLRLISSARIVVVENGLDDEDIPHFSGEDDSEDLSQKPLTFGSTMRFDAAKGPSYLVEAFVRLSESLPQLPMRLVIAGDGELFAEIKSKVETSGLEEKIHLLGWRPDIMQVLRTFDVFVVSSLREGGSYGTIEAMAAGLPVVSTDVFGTDETIVRVPGNIIVPVGSPDALATGMKQMAILSEPTSVRQELRRIGQSNRDYVRTHLKRSDTIRRTLEIYKGLCQ